MPKLHDCPIAYDCPYCRNNEYTKIKPNKTIYWAKDRVCTLCQTRYTPPTPIWGSMLFLILGAILAIASVVPIWGSIFPLNPCSLITIPLFSLLMAMGIIACIEGVQSMFRIVTPLGILNHPVTTEDLIDHESQYVRVKSPAEIRAIQWRTTVTIALVCIFPASFYCSLTTKNQTIGNLSTLINISCWICIFVLVLGIARRLLNWLYGILISLFCIFPFLNLLVAIGVIIAAFIAVSQQKQLRNDQNGREVLP